MWLYSFMPYHARKHFLDKSTSHAIYFIVLSQICHFLTWTLFAVSLQHTYPHVILRWKLLSLAIYSYAIQSAVSSIQNSWTLLPQMDPFLISECNIMHYNKSCSVLCNVQYCMWHSQHIGIVIKLTLNMVSVHYSWLHMQYRCIMLELYNHSFFYSAKLWAGKVGWPCTMDDAWFIYKKYLCQDNVLPADFTTPGWSGSS